MINRVIKRDNTSEEYDFNKIRNAILQATLDVNNEKPQGVATEVALEVENKLEQMFTEVDPTVEEIQDIVEDTLIENKYSDVAKAYILYRRQMKEEREQGWFDLELGESAWERKYQYKDESFLNFLQRVSGNKKEYERIIRRKEFCPAGRLLSNRGIPFKDKKTTYANCYYIPIREDSLEGIYRGAYEMARTYSYGGGVGIDYSILRPKGAKVNNAAKTTTGSVSFLPIYGVTGKVIGQKNRRGAGIGILDISHPDIVDFIEFKQDLENINSSNLSVKVTDKFMESVENDEQFELKYDVKDTGEIIDKEVSANHLMNKLAYTNYDYAEPGTLFWDRIKNWHIMSEHDEYQLAGVNPCGERPLPEYGACALSSINLASIVDDPYTEDAAINLDKLRKLTHKGVKYLNEVLDEGIDRHPLEEQKEVARKYRDIGLGVMGFADLLIKMGITYGSDESIRIIEEIGETMIKQAIYTSTELAEKNGPFPAYDDSVLESSFIQQNADESLKKRILEYGLRNASLLSIAPTGTISNIFGVSGGIEPFFNVSYTRKTESLGGETEEYKIFTPTIKELMEVKGIENQENLPEYVVTTHDVNYVDRIDVQAAWQQYIDSSISSTLNLPEDITIQEIKDAYIYGWKAGLKGMTVFRENCAREGILSNDGSETTEAEVGDFIESNVCPECQGELVHKQGCTECQHCGYSPCSV